MVGSRCGVSFIGTTILQDYEGLRNGLTADTDLLKMVPVEILLNFGNYVRTLQLGF